MKVETIPDAEVERVAPSEIACVELSMDALAGLTEGADSAAKLGAFATQYRQWIDQQRTGMPSTPARRRETAEEFVGNVLRSTGFVADVTHMAIHGWCSECARQQ